MSFSELNRDEINHHVALCSQTRSAVIKLEVHTRFEQVANRTVVSPLDIEALLVLQQLWVNRRDNPPQLQHESPRLQDWLPAVGGIALCFVVAGPLTAMGIVAGCAVGAGYTVWQMPQEPRETIEQQWAREAAHYSGSMATLLTLLQPVEGVVDTEEVIAQCKRVVDCH